MSSLGYGLVDGLAKALSLHLVSIDAAGLTRKASHAKPSHVNYIWDDGIHQKPINEAMNLSLQANAVHRHEALAVQNQADPGSCIEGTQSDRLM